MKKIFIYSTVALASMLALTNCTREEMPSQNEYEGTVPFSVNAGAPSLKTANDGAFGTDWVADDAINLFYASAGKTDYLTADKFTIASEDLATNTFRGFLVSELEDGASYDWFVVYPYNAATTAPGKALVNVASAVQTQAGDDNLAHIAGVNYPVCGKAKAVAASAAPEIAMQHLTSLVEVVVTNASAAPLTVSEIKLVAEEAIVGVFNVDVTKDAPSYSAVAADKVSSTATLNVTGAKELATGASAKYYFALKPFTAKTGTNLIISVNGIERILEMTKDVTFTAGLKKEIKFEYDLVLAPEVTIEDVAFSCAKIRWTSDGLAKSFNIYVNGELYKEGLPADTETYTVTGLNTGVDNKIEVEAVADDKARGEVTVKTKGVRLLGTSEHHVVIEWDEINPRGRYGNGSGNDRGYEIGVFKNSDLSEPLYTTVPYNGLSSKDYAYGNSSWLGKTTVNGTTHNLYVPTKLALGALEAGTTYYIAVRTKNGQSYTYSGTSYNITHKYGTSEWSKPLVVATQAQHQAAANEVIFENFDELSCFADRYHGAPGTAGTNYNLKDYSDVRVTSLGIFGNQIDHATAGFATQATGTAGNYVDGKTFSSFDVPYNNYVGNAPFSFAGWHFATSIRPVMGAIGIDRAQKRFIGTPLLERNLSEDAETECVLSFDLLSFAQAAKNEDIYIKRLRGTEETLLYTIPVSASFVTDNPTSSEYEIDYSDKKTITKDISLKKGDAVLIVAYKTTSTIFHVIDNFKIETK